MIEEKNYSPWERQNEGWSVLSPLRNRGLGGS